MSDNGPVATDHDLGDGRTAAAVERPETIEDLRQAVAARAGAGLAIYPQGGRTALGYGRPPSRRGVAFDLRRLDRVIEYPAADMTITVEAGITLGALQAVLAAEGQRLPLDAPDPDRATLGGIYATATSGPRRFGWGRARDLIIGVSFVTSDGEVVKGGGRVVKNVAGYDFPKLLTGSLGTLGVIAQMTLKVRPIPEASALLWLPLGRPEEVADTLDRLNTSAARPVAVELLNEPAARRLGEPIGLEAAPWVIVAGVEDNAASVAWQVEALAREWEGRSAAVLRDAEAAPLWRGLADHPAEGGYGAVSLTANVRPSGVVELVGALDAGRWAVQAHAGNGIVHLHAIGDGRDLNVLAPEVDALRREAVRLGGNLIVSRSPAAWKDKLRAWGEPRGDWPLMESIRAALDPRGLMNPGRFIGRM